MLRTPCRSLLLVLLLACGGSGFAAELYKCTTNGEVTYSNEPCKGQRMEKVDKGNMVHINDSPNLAPALESATPPAPAAADVPLVQWHDDSAPAPVAAPAPIQAAPPSGTGSFLQRLQEETQSWMAANPGQAPAAQNSQIMTQIQEMMADLALTMMPNTQDLAQETEKIIEHTVAPKLRKLLLQIGLGLLVLGLLLLGLTYAVVRLAVAHALAAQAKKAHTLKADSGVEPRL